MSNMFLYRFGLGSQRLPKNFCDKCKEIKRTTTLDFYGSYLRSAEILKKIQEIEGGN